MNKFVVTQLSILTLVGCASSGTYVNSSLLAPGMTKQEVISVLGKLQIKKKREVKKNGMTTLMLKSVLTKMGSYMKLRQFVLFNKRKN